MKLNFFTRSGKRRWGILPVYHMRLSFANGHTETVRLHEFSFDDHKMRWIAAPGQDSFGFSLTNLTSWLVVKKAYRLGVSHLLKENWRKGVK